MTETVKFSADLRKRNADRLSYIREKLEPLLNENPEQFYNSVSKRLVLAATDIFGATSSVVDALRTIIIQGPLHDVDIIDCINSGEVRFIEPQKTTMCLKQLEYEALCIHNRHTEYFLDENLMGLWTALEAAGMSHADIGRYFESYEETD